MHGRQTENKHHGRNARADKDHEPALAGQIVEAEADKKVSELISSLLKDHAEIEGNSQRCNGRNAVRCACYKGEQDRAAEGEHDPSGGYRNKKKPQLSKRDGFMLAPLRRFV